MDYERTGRILGTGVKVLGRMAKKRLDAADPPTQLRAATAASPRVTAVKEGGKRFGKSVLGPTVKAGHVLWLEITGLFFAFFDAGFAFEAWKLRAQWRSGADHAHFVAYAALVLLFTYFSATSFVKATRRSKR